MTSVPFLRFCCPGRRVEVSHRHPKTLRLTWISARPHSPLALGSCVCPSLGVLHNPQPRQGRGSWGRLPIKDHADRGCVSLTFQMSEKIQCLNNAHCIAQHFIIEEKCTWKFHVRPWSSKLSQSPKQAFWGWSTSEKLTTHQRIVQIVIQAKQR